MEYHDDQTLFKVRDALLLKDKDGYVRVDGSIVDNQILELQNAGILFREYRDDVRETWVGETTTEFSMEVEPVDENGEYAPLKKEEYLRITGLEMAINSAVRGASGAESLIARADLFVDYIKNGDNNA